MSQQKEHLIGLDLVRFMAAFSVVLFHLKVFHFGWVGVEVFFTLSGIVIVYSAKGSSASRFMINRIVRLAPCVWICASITALIWLIEGEIPRQQILRMYVNSVIFWPSPPWVDIVYWSLRFEIMFYAIVFVLLLLSALRFVTTVCIAIGVWSAYANFFPESHLLLALPSWLRQVTLSEYGCFFALGVLMYAASSKHRLAVLHFWIALFFTASVFAIKRVAVQGNLGAGNAAVLCFSILVLAMYGSIKYKDQLGRLIGRFAEQVRILGLMTYPLYLLHYSLLNFIYWSIPGVNSTLFDVLAVAFILLITLVITVLIEPPVRRRLKAVLERLLLLAKASLVTANAK